MCDTTRRRLLRAFRDLWFSHWFPVCIGAAIGLAAAAPRLGGWVCSDITVKMPATVATFLVFGLNLNPRVLRQALGDVRLHVLIQGLSLGLTPLVGFGIGSSLKARGLNAALADGLVILASVPTTAGTNVSFTSQAAGNTAAATVNAVLGSLLGMLASPALLSAFLHVEGQVPLARVALSLAYQVLAPLCLGQALQFIAPRLVAWFKSRVPPSTALNVSTLLLVWAMFCDTFAASRDGQGATAPASHVAAMVAMVAALFCLFSALCLLAALPPPPVSWATRTLLRVRRADAVAVLFCGAGKTVALGVPLTSIMYRGSPQAGLMATPLIAYHAVYVMLGALMLPAVRRWCLADPAGCGAKDAAPPTHAAAPAALLEVVVADKPDASPAAPHGVIVTNEADASHHAAEPPARAVVITADHAQQPGPPSPGGAAPPAAAPIPATDLHFIVGVAPISPAEARALLSAAPSAAAPAAGTVVVAATEAADTAAIIAAALSASRQPGVPPGAAAGTAAAGAGAGVQAPSCKQDMQHCPTVLELVRLFEQQQQQQQQRGTPP